MIYKVALLLNYKELYQVNYPFIGKYILKTEGMQESHSKVQNISF